ncbi:hypothetical protein BGX28_003720 [Mortierella sp. GBA30]|nr:hypothetical protein BGX28_003720 [Mortierella sp. GBA30]
MEWPYAIGIFEPLAWIEFDRVTLEFTRIAIAVQVMAAGVSLPRSYLLKEKRSLFMMIVPVMILMWFTSALLVWGMVSDLDFVEAMVLAACVTPTDPVLSNSVVKGRFAEKHVPPRIRYLLSAESGINDGLGLPFLYLGLYLMRERNVTVALSKWFYMVWAYQILMSVVIGGLIGAAARKVVKGAKNRNLIDKESFLVFSIALALAVVGTVSILTSDDLLACFFAGNVFAWDDWFSNEIAEAHIQETIDMLLNLTCFVYIGASIPFANFHDVTLGLPAWRLIALAVLILFLRRMPFVLMLKSAIPALTTYREAAFAGWFGPIGVGAVFFSKVAAKMTDPDNLGDNPYNVDRLLRVRSLIFPVVMFLVFSSVLIHGITVPLLHLQYKYTRTWSRKREEGSHAVTRLPHINIGDEIILRQPTLMAANMGGMLEAEGENQASVYQRPSGGFGISDVQDLSRTSISDNACINTRTLEDVVQEMKEAARGTTVWSPTYEVNGGNPRIPSTIVYGRKATSFPDSAVVQLEDIRSMGGYTPSTSTSDPLTSNSDPFRSGHCLENDSGSDKSIQSLGESHPAGQGLDAQPSDIQLYSVSGSSGGSSITILDPQGPTTDISFRDHPRRPLTSEFHDIYREEDRGAVRMDSHNVAERDHERTERRSGDNGRQHPDQQHIHSYDQARRRSFESTGDVTAAESGSRHYPPSSVV